MKPTILNECLGPLTIVTIFNVLGLHRGPVENGESGFHRKRCKKMSIQILVQELSRKHLKRQFSMTIQTRLITALPIESSNIYFSKACTYFKAQSTQHAHRSVSISDTRNPGMSPIGTATLSTWTRISSPFQDDTYPYQRVIHPPPKATGQLALKPTNKKSLLAHITAPSHPDS